LGLCLEWSLLEETSREAYTQLPLITQDDGGLKRHLVVVVVVVVVVVAPHRSIQRPFPLYRFLDAQPPPRSNDLQYMKQSGVRLLHS
jgi:hypothetical protein